MKRGRRLRPHERRSPAGRFSIALLFLLVFVSLALAGECEYHRVRWVIDGDTIVIDTGQKVRLIGVDTPEKGDRRRDVEFYAIEAMEFLRNTVQGRRVCLKKDPLHSKHTDDYGRLLRYLYLGKRFINKELLAKGYAYVFTSYPFSYIDEFRAIEARARAQGLGIWDNQKRCQWQDSLLQAMRLADTCGSGDNICPWQAGRFIGKRVKVRMFVHRVMEGREYVFLDSERDYKSPLNLRALLPASRATDPYRYLGRAIEVTGKVELYKNRPELRVDKIELLSP